MKKTANQWKEIYEGTDFQREYTYKEGNLGAACSAEQTRFLLWSPLADAVKLCLYEEGEDTQAYVVYSMERGDEGVWEYKVSSNLHGVYYDYIVEIDAQSISSADPYAKACGINGRRSMVVDLERTNPEGWQEDRAPKEEAERIIYEIHVKEFSWDPSGGFTEDVRGKYGAFKETDTTLYNKGEQKTGLSYLKELGITHVQLMPIYDYGSVDEKSKDDPFNWGYDPVNYNVPEGSYSMDPKHGEVRIREVKEMIQSLHKQGFRVIMDVVYNHTYSLDSWFQRIVPWYYYRLHEDGTVSNGSACGNDVASEREMCARYILESVLYWTEEYHIDGFRFDLMGLLDVELMNRIRGALDDRYGKGEKILFGEPWAADKTAIAADAQQALKENISQLDENVGIFCDNTRDAIKGSVFELEEPGFANGKEGLETDILHSVQAWCRAEHLGIKAPSQIISYVSSHDNQTLWDKLTDTVKEEALRKKAYRLAAGIYMTCQGSLFLLSGEEFARTKEGRDNTYNAPISLNRIDWQKVSDEQELVTYYKGLIALRKQLPGLCDKSSTASERIYGQQEEAGIVSFLVDNGSNTTSLEPSSWETVQVIYNSRQTREKRVLESGEWEILLDGADSFLWKHPKVVDNIVWVEPVSMLILGKRKRLI